MKQKNRKNCKHKWGKKQPLRDKRDNLLAAMAEAIIVFAFEKEHYQKCRKCGVLRLVL